MWRHLGTQAFGVAVLAVGLAASAYAYVALYPAVEWLLP